MVLGALLALGHRAEEDAEKEIAAVVNAWACNLESICSPTTTRESKETNANRPCLSVCLSVCLSLCLSVFSPEERAGRDGVRLERVALPARSPLRSSRRSSLPMEIPPSLRHLFQGGHEKYAIVDAHQMRHSAWGSPEGIMLIDSAGCAALQLPHRVDSAATLPRADSLCVRCDWCSLRSAAAQGLKGPHGLAPVTRACKLHTSPERLYLSASADSTGQVRWRTDEYIPSLP